MRALLLALALAAPTAVGQVRNDSFRVLTLHAPPEIARADTTYGQRPDWGGQPPAGGLTARIVLVRDSAGSELGCRPLANADEVAGNIAFIRREGCPYSQKALHAQSAGAVAFIIYDPPTTGGECFPVLMTPGEYGSLVTIPGAFWPPGRDISVEFCDGRPMTTALYGGAEVTVTLAPLFVGVPTEPGPEAGGLALSVAPNPVRGAATVLLTLPEAGAVRVAVYDVLGREVARLAEGHRQPGEHRIDVPASVLPPGAYAVRAEADGRAAATRLVVAR